MIKIGVIADDFTGATDIASFLVENGLPTVQINGVPTGKMPEAIDALVISLKTRSCPVVEATQQSLAALSWLQQQGCKQIYFKYCSTFDSTAKGNIGPVTDALMDALDTPFTVFSPSTASLGSSFGAQATIPRNAFVRQLPTSTGTASTLAPTLS